MLYDLHHRINSIFNAKRMECALLHVACLIWLLVQSCCTLGLTGNACLLHAFFFACLCFVSWCKRKESGAWLFTTNNCLDVAQTFPDILQIYSTPNAGSPIAVIYRRLIAWPVSLQFPSHPKKGAQAARPIAIQHICQRYDMNLCIYIYSNLKPENPWYYIFWAIYIYILYSTDQYIDTIWSIVPSYFRSILISTILISTSW